MSGHGMPSYGPPQRETEDRNWYYASQTDDRNRYSQYDNRFDLFVVLFFFEIHKISNKIFSINFGYDSFMQTFV